VHFVKWAVVGVGNIAHSFMQAVRHIPDITVVAAYGRNREKLDAFCDKWEIRDRYTDYNQMYEQSEAEIIYLATTHIVHFEHTLSAIQHGKHVLCEKPMAMSYEETKGLVDAAREKNVFLMEAMWTRFFPLTKWLMELIQSGELGKPVNVNADFSFEYPYDENYRFFRRDLGGGCMRSAGIYPLAYSCMVFGCLPVEIKAIAQMKHDVDLRTAALLRFPEDRTAELYTGFQGQSKTIANIAFEKGAVVIPEFVHPDTAYVIPYRGEGRTVKFPYEEPGLQFEIEHVEECIKSGKMESTIMPLDESIEIARAIDLVYEQIRG
jgi:predicted dehydrogenase